MAVLERFGNAASDWMYLVFRVIFGIMFSLHGAQKLGWLGREAVSGMMLIVGIGELLIGLGIVLGVLTRVASVGGLIIMIGALTTAHWPRGFMPLGNGEAAWLFLGAFLLILAMGNGRLSLERAVLKKELV